jgi:hypothetical protein
MRKCMTTKTEERNFPSGSYKKPRGRERERAFKLCKEG